MASENTAKLLRFIDGSMTAFHAVASTEKQLEEAGFCRLNESEEWNPKPGKGYFVTRNQSSVIAFRMPLDAPEEFMISASHTDSPSFKIKTASEAPAFGTYQRLAVENYGGMISSTWLDRPLSLAGRVILSEDGKIVSRLVAVERDLLIIPNVAIHQNRSINSGFAYNTAVDLLPLMGEGTDCSLRQLLSSELGCAEDAIMGFDLFLYNRAKGTTFGVKNEFFAAPRIDDLMCLYGTLRGFLDAGIPQGAVNVFFAADNEETGSSTKQGAGSLFLSDTLSRICEACGLDKRRLLASSMMVSADNGHARHPNHPEFSDANNSPRLNGGVVVKTNASQNYATDGVSAALFCEICRRAGVPTQLFANRSDMPGGSTLGSISNTRVPLMTVDIGMAQLAMHSAYETAGCADVDALIGAMTAFYGTRVVSLGDGIYRLAVRS